MQRFFPGIPFQDVKIRYQRSKIKKCIVLTTCQHSSNKRWTMMLSSRRDLPGLKSRRSNQEDLYKMTVIIVFIISFVNT